jgi:hypothetical protein
MHYKNSEVMACNLPQDHISLWAKPWSTDRAEIRRPS